LPASAVQSRRQLNPKLSGEAGPARQQHRLPEYSWGGIRARSPDHSRGFLDALPLSPWPLPRLSRADMLRLTTVRNLPNLTKIPLFLGLMATAG
jgi:hypothetical protein